MFINLDAEVDAIVAAVNASIAEETGDHEYPALKSVNETVVVKGTRWVKVYNGNNTSWVNAFDGFADDLENLLSQ